jgi:hypothetical protein
MYVGYCRRLFHCSAHTGSVDSCNFLISYMKPNFLTPPPPPHRSHHHTTLCKAHSVFRMLRHETYLIFSKSKWVLNSSTPPYVPSHNAWLIKHRTTLPYLTLPYLTLFVSKTQQRKETKRHAFLIPAWDRVKCLLYFTASLSPWWRVVIYLMDGPPS